MYESKRLSDELMDVLYVHTQLNEAITPDRLKNIMLAAEFGGLEILRSHVKEPIGYVIFAKVNSDNLRLLKLNGGKIDFPHQWNSGYILFIVDTVILRSQCTLAKRRLFSLGKSKRCFAYIKKDKFKIKFIKSKSIQ